MTHFTNKNGEFQQKLQAEVNKYFRENKISKNGDWRNLTQYFATFSTLIASWAVLFVLKPHLFISIWFWILMGFCIGMLCILGHEAVHNCFSDKKNYNNLVKHTLNFLGGNWQHYRFKHSLHHNYTNILKLDDDINFWPFIRTNNSDKFYFWHRFQLFYTPFLYCLSAFFLIFDFGFLNDKNTAEFRPTKLTKTNISLFWLAKIWHILVFFVVPGFTVGFGWVIGGYLLMMSVAGLYLSLVVQPSHIFTGTSFWELENDKINLEWAKLITLTTTNYGNGNRFLTYFSGGMNFHLVHSLFPSISFIHYPKLCSIILSICDECEVKYQEFPTVISAIYSHFSHLAKMSRQSS